MDGFRKTIEDEFSSIWVFNLRGNQRTSGELSRKEGGKIFGSGSRTPISITLLVKNPNAENKKAKIHYHDIGDYLSREEKLATIKDFGFIANPQMKWTKIKPNEHGDWVNQRNDMFQEFIPLDNQKKFDIKGRSFFVTHSLGVATGRDVWVYNFSRSKLEQTVHQTITFFNQQMAVFSEKREANPFVKARDIIEINPAKISWNHNFLQDITRGKKYEYSENRRVRAMYRPYCKAWLYFDSDLNARQYQNRRIFPDKTVSNLMICVSGLGGNKDSSTIIVDSIVDLNCLEAGAQCFLLYYYEERKNTTLSLFDKPNEGNHIRRDGVSDFILKRARGQYGKNVAKEDIFYYVYGILHSTDYREKFANDLKKMLPRLPLVEEVKDFWKFSQAGRKLADLHINYEDVAAYGDVQVEGLNAEHFKVEKMRFAKVRKKVEGSSKLVDDKTTIHYNSSITISNIPEKAYEYVINGKSAIDWVMERYQITIDKKSGITNDPNDWAAEVGNPRYILDLLLSVINVSVQTVDIVKGLPKLDFE